MRGTPIYRDVSLGAVKFERIVEEIEDKSFTGFIKISHWGMEDYLYYLKGKPLAGIRHFSEYRSEKISLQSHKPFNDRGILYLYATSPIDIFAFLESLEERVSPYTFVTY